MMGIIFSIKSKTSLWQEVSAETANKTLGHRNWMKNNVEKIIMSLQKPQIHSCHLKHCVQNPPSPQKGWVPKSPGWQRISSGSAFVLDATLICVKSHPTELQKSFISKNMVSTFEFFLYKLICICIEILQAESLLCTLPHVKLSTDFLECNLWAVAFYEICKSEDERANAISFSIPL